MNNVRLSRNRFSRRRFLRAGAWGLAGWLGGGGRHPAGAARLPGETKWLTIQDIHRTTVKLPFRDVPGRNMARELPHWAWSEICRVTLKSGSVGHGETLLYYTWGATSDAAVQRAQGRNAAELMWDDALGAGLQAALFDAVARTLDVPIHCLLGRKVHDRTPLSWWNIDTSPADMASECRTAHRSGYLSYKTKGRPWFDIWEQVSTVARAVPDSFHLAMDFNATLLDAERGIPILKDLESVPQLEIWETPIPQSDLRGNQTIRAATRQLVAMHYGNPQPHVALKEDVCDGFVIGGGARRVLQQGSVSAMADKPFWLQLVGTSITAAWSLHVAAVLSHATWPAVNCHQLFDASLLAEPVRVENGTAEVPDRPGLGFEINEDLVERFRVPKPSSRPDPPRLIETAWPDGRKMYVANTGRVNFMLNPAMAGTMPYFERGVATRLVPNDGSARWRNLYDKAREGPYLT